ncbi:MAG: thioredoxin domain-containing protein [Chloroflexi bacterium]|nr:thioredoxin domain-containing protein [Chloroflexota bacterium]
MTTSAVKRKASSQPNRQLITIVGIVVIVVAVVAIIAILLSGNRSSDIDVASLPQSRQADGGFVLGNPNAPITVIEFADFACPHCQEYHPVITQFLADYVVPGKAKFEYRVFPTAGGQTSEYTGKLLECAEDQKAGNFWKGYNLMFNYAFSGRYTQDVGRLLANDEGLNYSDLLTCTSTATQVTTDVAFGQNSGVTGTPAVMVRYGDGSAQFVSYNGKTYNSGGVPYSVLAAITDAAQ